MIEETPGFGLDHLPYGSVRFASGRRSLAVRIGDDVLDLRALAREGLAPAECDAPDLDRLLATRPERWATVRETAIELLTSARYRSRVEPHLWPATDVEWMLPFTVGDYVDFYSCEAHATTVGKLFRPNADPLPRNWKVLPIGYHGRSGTVVPTGTDVVRPSGQVRDDGGSRFAPTSKLDFEVEMGWVVGGSSAGPQPIDSARDRIFGFMPVNDWSARDIQALETVPLGPFLGKSFATSIGAWVTPLAALESATVAPPFQDPAPSSYLVDPDPWCVDVELTASLSTGGPFEEIASMRYRDLYWTPAQQFAHLTVNGATARPGDLCASGTISGWEEDEKGCLLERTSDGATAFALSDGTERRYLEDGDVVKIAAVTTDGSIDLGSVVGRVVAAP